MSGFTEVDAAPDPDRLVAALAESANGLAGMKHYMAATHRRRGSARPALNVGCGSGHDLLALERLGIFGVGIDPSFVMLTAAATEVRSPLVRASGERLPFRDSTFSGAWIERVLMHVAEPAAVISEAARCVERGGVLTVFEPDWSSLTVNGEQVPVSWGTTVRHPRIGTEAGNLLEAAGCDIEDRVEERSWWPATTFQRLMGARFEQAIASGRADGEAIRSWWVDTEASIAKGEFRSQMVKILWVASAP